MEDTKTKAPHGHSALIDALGGTVEAAKLCEVKPQAVSQWRIDGIPKARMMFLRLKRPDLFGKRAKVAA